MNRMQREKEGRVREIRMLWAGGIVEGYQRRRDNRRSVLKGKEYQERRDIQRESISSKKGYQ